MADDYVVINVHMQAAPGREEELAGHLLALVAPTRNESGCISYDLHRDPEDPAKFMFYERFASKEAFESHGLTPHIQRFRGYREAHPGLLVSSVLTTWRLV
jgi:quinol monooxygenase YgiN